MTERTEREKCSCCPDSAAGTQLPPADDGVTKVLKAQVPQTYEARFNVRIVPGRSLDDAVVHRPGCRPRGHAQPRTPGTFEVAPELIATLGKADKAMVAWLANDKTNAQRFLEDPVAAMRDAGVQLSRVDEKSLARASAAAAAARVVPPGANVTAVKAEAFLKGAVGSIAPVSSTPSLRAVPRHRKVGRGER